LSKKLPKCKNRFKANLGTVGTKSFFNSPESGLLVGKCDKFIFVNFIAPGSVSMRPPSRQNHAAPGLKNGGQEESSNKPSYGTQFIQIYWILPSQGSFNKKKKYIDSEVKYISKIFKRELPKYILEKNTVFRKKGCRTTGV
jgi:hypothetical protein